MGGLLSFSEYLASLSRMTPHVDPTVDSPTTANLRSAASDLASLPEVDRPTLTAWIQDHPAWVPVLGLTVGLTQEKLKNTLAHEFDTSGWRTLARERAPELIDYFDNVFDLVGLLERQRESAFTFADLIVARAGSRALAVRASSAGRQLEDEIEKVATDLGLMSETRTRFKGRGDRTAPCDLVIPGGGDAQIVVAAKAFDSTGSKLTDAVREVIEMAEVRLPNQVVYAVVDGIGWKSRKGDLQRLYDLRASNQIDGLYTLKSFDTFRVDLAEAARLRHLIP